MESKKRRIPHNLIVLSDCQERFIRDNFFSMTNPEIAKAIGLNLTTTRKHAYRMGLKRMNLEYWCNTSIRFLRLYYKYIGDTEMAEIFTKHFPKEKGWTKKHIEKKRRYLGLKRTDGEMLVIKKRNTDSGRFVICNTKRWLATGKAKIGDVHIWDRDGLKMAYIKTEKGFVPRNRWLWQQAYGPISRNEIVWAKEGSPVICTLDDLELIPIEELSYRNKMSGSSIIKQVFKIKDTLLARKLAEENPELVDLQRNIVKFKRKLNERTRTEQQP